MSVRVVLSQTTTDIYGERSGHTHRGPDADQLMKSRGLVSSLERVAAEHGSALNFRTETRSESRPLNDTRRHFDGFAPEILHTITTLAVPLGSASVGLSFLKTVRPIVLKWLELYYGRTVKVRCGRREITATTPSDLDRAIAALESLEQIPLREQGARKRKSEPRRKSRKPSVRKTSSKARRPRK